jgi:uncharacterized membrane protein YfcA
VTPGNVGLLVLGFFVGLASASLGVGGGVLIVPALIIFFKFDFKKAAGTSLAVIFPTAIVGAIAYFLWDCKSHGNNLLLATAAITSIGAIIGAPLGVKLAHITNEKILKILFTALLIFTSLELLNIIHLSITPIQNAQWPWLIVLGLFAGASSGLLGIGGGVIIVPVLILFFACSIHQAIPTSLAIMIPTTLAGGMFHLKLNGQNVGTLKYIVSGSTIGAIIGVIVKNQLPENSLRAAFAVFLIICSIKIITSVFRKNTKTQE